MRRFMKKCDIIVVRRGGASSCPCARCLKQLKNCGFRRVYYSEKGDLKMEKVNQMENNHLSSKYRRPWSSFKNNK